MGMSSSQARLLNLTSRMHQIEYKAAKLEAAKLQMANESSKVYDEYLFALDQTKIQRGTIAADGSVGYTDLTAKDIFTFQGLKNQFTLITNDGRALMTESVSNNYKNTNSLSEFLDAYGLNTTYTQTVHHSIPNPDYVAAVASFRGDHSAWVANSTAYNKYQSDLATYNTRHDAWVARTAAYTQYQSDLADYNTQHAQWSANVAAYAQYRSDLANYNTLHTAWENAADNYNNYLTAKAQYDADIVAWNNRNNAYNTYLAQKAIHDTWATNKAAYDQYLIDKANYDAWVAADPQPLKDDKTQAWWDKLETGVGREGLDADFVTAASFTCYGLAKNGTPSCYGHVLAHMLDYDGGDSFSGITYTTSLGGSVKTSGYTGGCHGKTMTDIQGNETTTNAVFKEVSDVVATGQKVNVYGETFVPGTNDYEKLLSKFNSDGTAKSLKQWIIDLLYITQKYSSLDGYPTNAEFGATIEDIQNSLAASLYYFNETLYEQAVTNWTNNTVVEPTLVNDPGAEPTVVVAPAPGVKPTEPTYVEAPATEPVAPAVVNAPGAEPTAPAVVNAPGAEPTAPTVVNAPGAEPQIEDYTNGLDKTIEWDEQVVFNTFTNKDLTQWYINLWAKMEGQDDVPAINEQIVHDDATNKDVAIYSCEDAAKSATTYTTNPTWNVEQNENYIVIPNDKLSDANWLKNAIIAGQVLIQEYNQKSSKFFDTSVSTNTYFQEVSDEVLIKKAEAKYEADMKKIDMKDRRYDVELAAIDNERNAIKQEIETLKTVAKENVERTFKLFS